MQCWPHPPHLLHSVELFRLSSFVSPALRVLTARSLPGSALSHQTGAAAADISHVCWPSTTGNRKEVRHQKVLKDEFFLVKQMDGLTHKIIRSELVQLAAVTACGLHQSELIIFFCVGVTVFVRTIQSCAKWEKLPWTAQLKFRHKL